MKVNSGIRQWYKIETWSTPTTPTSLWGDIKLGITELVSLLPFWSLRWLLNRKGKHCWWSSVDAGVRSSWTFDELCSCVFWSPIPQLCSKTPCVYILYIYVYIYISNIFDMVYSFALTCGISEFHYWRQGTCESQFHRLATVLQICEPYSHPAIHRYSQWYSNIQHSVKTQHKYRCIDQLIGISRPRKHPQPDSKTKPPCRYGATCSLTEAFGQCNNACAKLQEAVWSIGVI